MLRNNIQGRLARLSDLQPAFEDKASSVNAGSPMAGQL